MGAIKTRKWGKSSNVVGSVTETSGKYFNSIDSGTLRQTELVEITGQEGGTQKIFLFRCHLSLLLTDVLELVRPRGEAGEKEERHFSCMEGSTQRPERQKQLDNQLSSVVGHGSMYLHSISKYLKKYLIFISFFDDILEIYAKLIQQEKTNKTQTTESN